MKKWIRNGFAVFVALAMLTGLMMIVQGTARQPHPPTGKTETAERISTSFVL